MKRTNLTLVKEVSERNNYQVLTVNEMMKIRGGGGEVIDPTKKS